MSHRYTFYGFHWEVICDHHTDPEPEDYQTIVAKLMDEIDKKEIDPRLLEE